MASSIIHHPASFRDPSGFVFDKNGTIYRAVNQNFKENFDHFIHSGCYEHLVKKDLLIKHNEIRENLSGHPEYYLTLQPEKIHFITYPYEWSFDMLKDAALLTLQLVKESIPYGLILKDATPYNIQWHNGKLIFIDTLSFEKYKEEPWIAYRQFCENFLSPLLLMHYAKTPLQEFMLAFPEGIPLNVTKALLPNRSRYSLHAYLHIHLHARLGEKNKGKEQKTVRLSKPKLFNLIASLESFIQKLRLPAQKSTWSEYYDEAHTPTYLEEKKRMIHQWISALPNIATAADLGANTGFFSKLLAEKNIQTIATDFDPFCINNLYNEIKTNRLPCIQPVLLDLSNPTPAIGVNNEERESFIHRCKVDLVLALAVIHHLVIGKNFPFEKAAKLFSQLGQNLIIEFIPKEDEKIKLMLTTKKDIYQDYNEANFTQSFEKYFTIKDKQMVKGSHRMLYLMERNATII